MESHTERLAQEGQDLRAKIQEILKQLGEAEEALHFYGNPRNYTVKGENTGKFHNVLIADYTESDNVKNVFVAGNRAREYFKKFHP